jgi:hypothetical protein
MGPTEGPSNHPKNQDTTRWPRTRRCLLKGCPLRFRPKQASQRYCGPQCRQAALEWSRWKAQRKYRVTKHGKEKRKAQCQRNRDRVKGGKKQGSDAAAATAARVISQKSIFEPSCDRPGCYELFVRSPRSPRQRFCSSECRRALERVWERERRWKERSEPHKESMERSRNRARKATVPARNRICAFVPT